MLAFLRFAWNSLGAARVAATTASCRPPGSLDAVGVSYRYSGFSKGVGIDLDSVF